MGKINVIAIRARDMQEMPKGGMLSVRASEEKVSSFLSGSLAIAGINSPKLCVVAGPHDELKSLVSELEKEEIMCKELHTSHAFHSPMMDPMVEPFKSKVSEIELSPAQIPIVSSFTGDWIQASEWTDPSYWANQLRGTVRFADAVKVLAEDSDRIFLEVGPGQTLTTLALANQSPQNKKPCFPSMPPSGSPNDQATMQTTLGKLWLAGVEPDWDAFFVNESRGRISLPTYPFERKRCWVEPTPQSQNSEDLLTLPSTGSVENIILDQLQAMKRQIKTLANSF